MQPVSLGLEQLMASPSAYTKGQRIGLLCNSASLDSQLVHARKRMHALFGSRLTALFSPQHGLFAEKQDNMVESPHRRDPLLNIPVFSLYSDTRIPTREMLDLIDVLFIDLQDVGTRVYTFIYTMSYCMEAAHQHGRKVVVLDRPNPVGGDMVEGNCLDSQWCSFVGRFPIPMRHGLTIGELARLFNRAYDIDCDLEVIPMHGWRRNMCFTDTGLPWVAPSPNMPTPVTTQVYPGQVLWEGTNISEGRGTTQPFEVFGAPFLDTEAILQTVDTPRLEGCTLRPLEFEPTAHKFAGTPCRGFQIHVTDARRFAPYRTSLALLQAIIKHHKEDFAWKAPPYEYEYHKLPIDLILGDGTLRKRIENLEPLAAIETSWTEALTTFDELRRDYFLYA
jgi:uncharacterized protein YbbC (DUF1343 family)